MGERFGIAITVRKIVVIYRPIDRRWNGYRQSYRVPNRRERNIDNARRRGCYVRDEVVLRCPPSLYVLDRGLDLV